MLHFATRVALPLQRTMIGVCCRKLLPYLSDIINMFATHGFFFAEGNVANGCVESVNGQKPA